MGQYNIEWEANSAYVEQRSPIEEAPGVYVPPQHQGTIETLIRHFSPELPPGELFSNNEISSAIFERMLPGSRENIQAYLSAVMGYEKANQRQECTQIEGQHHPYERKEPRAIHIGTEGRIYVRPDDPSERKDHDKAIKELEKIKEREKALKMQSEPNTPFASVNNQSKFRRKRGPGSHSKKEKPVLNTRYML